MTSSTTIADIATKIAGVTNRGAWTGKPTTSNTKVTIPAGYHNGSGYVDASLIVGKNADLKTMFLDYRRTTIPAQSSGTYSIDISSKISCYKKLTINNFWIQYVNMNGAGASLLGNGGYNNAGSPTSQIVNIGSYNATTGTLQVSYKTSATSNAIFEASIIAVYIDEV